MGKIIVVDVTVCQHWCDPTNPIVEQEFKTDSMARLLRLPCRQSGAKRNSGYANKTKINVI